MELFAQLARALLSRLFGVGAEEADAAVEEAGVTEKTFVGKSGPEEEEENPTKTEGTFKNSIKMLEEEKAEESKP